MNKNIRVCDICEGIGPLKIEEWKRFNYNVTGGKKEYNGADLCNTCRDVIEETIERLRPHGAEEEVG